MKTSEKLKKLYQEMADLTLPECRNCRVPLSCCSPEYCTIARDYAIAEGVKLTPTNHSKLPFMGDKGCIVPPYLRPHCTLHTCAINSLGFKPKDKEWTKKYFELREKIDEAEYNQK